MRATLAICLSLLIASTYAATFSFTGNVTLSSNQTTTFKFRDSSISEISVGSIGYHASYRSVNVGATGLDGVSGDLLYGEIFSGTGIMPLGYLSYWTGEASLGANLTLDFNASNAFVGGAFVSLTEKDPSGTVVQSMPLTGTLLGLTGMIWQKSDSGDSGDGLKWATVTGTSSLSPYGNLVINITFFVTDKVGVINLANTVVTPRTLETVVTINNWPYVSNSNHLTLMTGVATASGSLSGSSTDFITGTGVNKVYAALQGTAQVSGSSANIQITASVGTDWSPLGTAADTIKNAVTAKYGSSANIVFFDIDFPAGASAIVWDPTFGQGDQLVVATSSAASVAVAGIFIALAALLALLF